MKNKIAVFTLVFLCLLTPVFARATALPAAAQKVLDTKFKGWSLAVINKEIIDYYKNRPHGDSLNSVKGDWNGDRQMDYAVLLQNSQNAEKKVIVLMKSANGYDSYVLDYADCILVVKKGGKGFDHEANKSFRNKNDAINAQIWEKSATTYVWETKRFRGIITSD